MEDTSVDLMSESIFNQVNYASNQKVLATLLLVIAKHLVHLAFPKETAAQVELASALQLSLEERFEEIGTITLDALTKNVRLVYPFSDVQVYLNAVINKVAKPITHDVIPDVLVMISDGFELLHTLDDSQQWDEIISRNFEIDI